ncbi:MAG: hypothetical protein HY902_12720 [Deltaproteobacteria bacterium]|nr:hypothetical protein [Deltaproteobacteria bacterium]
MADQITLKLPLPGQSAEDPGLVAETLAEVNAAFESGALHTSRAIASVVLARMFHSDPRRFLAEGEEHASFQALLGSPDLQVGKAALWYALAIERNFALFPAASEHLTVSRHRRLVHVKDEAQRTQLAERAVAEGLTVVQLESAIAALQPPRPADWKPTGRPKLPEPVKGLTRVHAAIAKLDADITGMSEDQVAELLSQAEAHKAALEQWIATVRGQLEV